MTYLQKYYTNTHRVRRLDIQRLPVESSRPIFDELPFLASVFDLGEAKQYRLRIWIVRVESYRPTH
jgi:hypothetical protein